MIATAIVKLARRMPLSAQRGFTLLEAMIALLIVAMALPALLSLVMAQLDGSASIRDKTYAYWVAENELTRIRLMQQQKLQQKLPSFQLPERDVGVTELAGLRWQWQLQTFEMDSLPVKGFKRIEIEVRLLGLAKGMQLGGGTVDDNLPSLARLTGYLSDPQP
jgi:general secretion pathway protein I